MKNNPLHQSEELAKHFAPYRDEAPLLSTPQIEKLLSEHDMLPNQTRSTINLRKIIMTLSGITGIAAIVYFAFFSNLSSQSNLTDKSYTTHQSHETPQETQQTNLKLDSTSEQKQAIKLTLTKNNDNGPWSAGNDINYADLSREELARLGIVLRGDTVVTYNLNYKDSVEGEALTAHSFSDRHLANFPQMGLIPHFYPALMTFSNGHGAFYRIENGKRKECGMISGDTSEQEAQRPIREWLATPGTPGLSAYKINEISVTVSPCEDCPSVETDTIHIQIGKDLPQPLLHPLNRDRIRRIADSMKDAILELANYYAGITSSKPNFSSPKNLWIKVDTLNAHDLLEEMDRNINSTSMQHLRSIMSKINELVPVRVSTNPSNKDSSFILWYEPSEELFAALPEAVAKAERARLAEPPHCLSAPDAVQSTAEITYCVNKPQSVEFLVRDLTGKLMLSSGDYAVAGDNVWQFSTSTLPSGMYLVTVRNADGSDRTRRIWVENANPKTQEEYMDETINNALKDGTNVGGGRKMNETNSSRMGIPAIPMFEPSNDDDFLRLGIESLEFQCRFYERSPWNPIKILVVNIVRAGGCQIQNVDSQFVQDNVPSFHPQFVTDGTGGKRAVAGDSSILLFGDKNYDEINNLIPVLLRKDSAIGPIGANDLIFWYKPTPEFLAALSDSARTVAQQMIGNKTSNTASVEEMHGAISRAVAYPNPSKGEFSVDMTLDAPRNLTFTLRNLLGQPVAPPVQVRSEGESTQSLDFHSVGEGVYLLDITSDAGERFVQRVVIAR